MQKIIKFWLIFLVPVMLICPTVQAQDADTLQKYENPNLKISSPKPFYKSKIFKATIVPAILIGYGVSTIHGHGFYSSYDAQRDILHHFPNFKTTLDNPLIIAPYVELAIVNLLKINSNNDFLNTSLLIVKAEAIFAVSAFGLKYITHIERPNHENRYSMPSGHTAQAFLAASILHTELRHKSQWYGVGAYTIATGVGAIQMLRNKHWESDVFVGAGIGILSAHMAYLTHRNRWGRKPFALAPIYLYGAPGLALSININELSKD